MSMFNGKKKRKPAPPPALEEEKPMANLQDAIKDTEEAAKEFLDYLAKLKESGEVSKGDKVVKRVKRASMTLTEELVDFRKKLP